MRKTGKSGHKKRPHILPPLSLPKGSVNPMEPLKPPSALMTLDGRLGSPIPRWHRPHFEELEQTQENPSDTKPGIRITPCDNEKGSKQTYRTHWNSELKNDPLYKEDSDMLYYVQRRNSIKTLGLDQRNNQTVRSGTEKSPRLGTPVVRSRPKIDTLSSKYSHDSEKGFISSKYAPLKPIQRKMSLDQD